MLAEIAFLEGSFVIVIPIPKSRRTLALIKGWLKRSTGWTIISQEKRGKMVLKPKKAISPMPIGMYENLAHPSGNVGRALRLAGIEEFLLSGDAKHYA